MIGEITQVDSILGLGDVYCRRCGRPLTNPKSLELGYGPVCWKTLEVELWLGDVAVPKAYIPNSLSRRKIQKPPMVEPLVAAQRTLDEFFFEQIEPYPATIPTQTAVLAEG